MNVNDLYYSRSTLTQTALQHTLTIVVYLLFSLEEVAQQNSILSSLLNNYYSLFYCAFSCNVMNKRINNL